MWLFERQAFLTDATAPATDDADADLTTLLLPSYTRGALLLGWCLQCSVASFDPPTQSHPTHNRTSFVHVLDLAV
jgi:hypothetical protein